MTAFLGVRFRRTSVHNVIVTNNTCKCKGNGKQRFCETSVPVLSLAEFKIEVGSQVSAQHNKQRTCEEPGRDQVSGGGWQGRLVSRIFPIARCGEFCRGRGSRAGGRA